MAAVLPGEIHDIFSSFAPKLETYENIYKKLHQNGELSKCEKETAALMADTLRALSPDLEIKTGIGGHGLIAICKNGPGKTVLLRADMDALPVQERTDLPYRSHKTMPDAKGTTKPVMHACGHDFHMACGLAAADILIQARELWSGTCIFLFQPAEETISGARAMVEDGLYDSERHGCPLPDILLGQHVLPLPAGSVGTRSGPLMAASDNFRIVIHGRGGHGSAPHRTIDPVVTACHIVVRMQSIVSREVPPMETAVLTVGSIKAGDAPNVIPDEAEIQVNMRTYDTKIRQRVIDAMNRIVKAECEAGNCAQAPSIELFESTPLLVNDSNIHSIVNESFADFFGHRHIPDVSPVSASEDFAILGSLIGKPYYFWLFGGYPLDEEESGIPLQEFMGQNPVNHNPKFAPVLQPTLQTGAHAMVVAALSAFRADFASMV